MSGLLIRTSHCKGKCNVKIMKKYNRANCTGSIRAEIIDKWGRKITLTGIHAFDWSIYIEGITGNIAIEHYSNGGNARKRFNELKKRK